MATNVALVAVGASIGTVVAGFSIGWLLAAGAKRFIQWLVGSFSR